MKNSFMLYTDTLCILDELDDAQCGRLFRAIRAYHEGDSETLEMLMRDQVIRLSFNQFKTQFSRDQKRYDEKVEKRKIAGRLGGLQRVANQTKQNQANQANASNAKQNQANQADSVRESESVSVLQDTNVSMCSIITSPSKEEDVLQSTDSNYAKVVRYDAFVKLWNTCIRGTAHHAITDIKDGTQRRTWVSARIKEYGVEAVVTVIKNAAKSSFLNGNNKKGVTYGFDWIMRPNNFPKVLEGNYNDAAPSQATEQQKPVAQVTEPRNLVKEKADNDRKFYDWCKANGKNPNDTNVCIEYFNITKK